MVWWWDRRRNANGGPRKTTIYYYSSSCYYYLIWLFFWIIWFFLYLLEGGGQNEDSGGIKKKIRNGICPPKFKRKIITLHQIHPFQYFTLHNAGAHFCPVIWDSFPPSKYSFYIFTPQDSYSLYSKGETNNKGRRRLILGIKVIFFSKTKCFPFSIFQFLCSFKTLLIFNHLRLHFLDLERRSFLPSFWLVNLQFF